MTDPNVTPRRSRTPENVLSASDGAPMTDVDEIAVERAVHGDRTVHLNRAELFLAFAALNAGGHSAKRIGGLLGVSERSVTRWRQEQAFPKCRPGVGTTIPLPSKVSRPRVRPARTCEECGASLSSSHMARHRRRNHSEVSV